MVTEAHGYIKLERNVVQQNDNSMFVCWSHSIVKARFSNRAQWMPAYVVNTVFDSRYVHIVTIASFCLNDSFNDTCTHFSDSSELPD